MRDHLDGGCRSCAETVNVLRRVAGEAAAEFEPPEHVTQGALALFGALQGERSGMRRVPVEVAFDSALAPRVAGVRTTGASARHFILNSRDLTIDARLDSTGEEQLSVVGQVVTRAGSPVAELPAFVVTRGRVLAYSRTTRMGEFQMACRGGEDLRLCLAVGDKELIEVDLDRCRPLPAPGDGLATDDLV